MNLSRRFLPIEQRGIQCIERRAEDGTAAGLPKIVGTAAVYFDPNNRAGTQYALWRNAVERILPGAFDEAVKRDDVRALQNHDPRMLLGRSSAGTLKLMLGSHGLDYEIDTPDTSAGRDTIVSLRRGDLTGSSFLFRPIDGGVEWTDEEVTLPDGTRFRLEVRNIKGVELFDVGPVTYPCYSATAAGARSYRSAGVLAMTDGEIPSELKAIEAEHAEFVKRNYDQPEAERRMRDFELFRLSAGL